MKSNEALHIAEHLWHDVVFNEHLRALLMAYGVNTDNRSDPRNAPILQTNAEAIKAEIVARWANIIQEVSDERHIDV